MTRFARTVAIDWSGANAARPKGLAVAFADQGTQAPELLQTSAKWSRQAILDWLVELASTKQDVLIGLDLSPALPFVDCGSYFPGWEASPTSAHELWAMVDAISGGDEHMSANGFLAHEEAYRHFRHFRSCGDKFSAGRGRLRVCEWGQHQMGLSPQSCFNLVGAAQVGKSSLTGMRVLHRLAGEIPVWPFDPVPKAGPVIVEIYTTIAARAAGVRKGRSKIREARSLDAALKTLGVGQHAPLASYDDHSTDAIVTAAWMRAVAEDNELWNPPALTPHIARTEGWTFGVT